MEEKRSERKRTGKEKITMKEERIKKGERDVQKKATEGRGLITGDEDRNTTRKKTEKKIRKGKGGQEKVE